MTARVDPLDLVRLLIGFDTTSRGTNLPLIDFVQELLESAGARCRRTPDPDRIKANLFATFGPDAPGGIVLSGHTDVVPVDGQEWSSDPFKAEIRENKLFGRDPSDQPTGGCWLTSRHDGTGPVPSMPISEGCPSTTCALNSPSPPPAGSTPTAH